MSAWIYNPGASSTCLESLGECIHIHHDSLLQEISCVGSTHHNRVERHVELLALLLSELHLAILEDGPHLDGCVVSKKRGDTNEKGTQSGSLLHQPSPLATSSTVPANVL